MSARQHSRAWQYQAVMLLDERDQNRAGRHEAEGEAPGSAKRRRRGARQSAVNPLLAEWSRLSPLFCQEGGTLVSPRTERRLGHVLLEALELACRQGDIDVARRIETLIDMIIGRRKPGTPERRKQWLARVDIARGELRALERSLRRSG
jgi:hypothetical protein